MKVTDIINPQPSLAQTAALKKQIVSLRRQNKLLLEDLGSEADIVQQVQHYLRIDQPYRFQPTIYQPGLKHVSAVIMLGDWHIGEVIEANEIEGVNAYDYEIAKRRIFEIVEDFLKWTKTQRAGYVIDELHVFCVADWISGTIHEELLVTNEFPAIIQAVRAGQLLGEVFRIFDANFKKVTAWEIAADNHGRLTRKPPMKHRADDNYSQATYAISNEVALKCKHLQTKLLPGVKAVVPVQGFKFLITHGNDMRGWMGLPFYAIQRAFGREAIKRMKLRREYDLGFDYLALGHFHVPTILESMVLINGSLCGTTELDHINGRYAKPAQCAWLVSPKHGYFNWTEFRGK